MPDLYVEIRGNPKGNPKDDKEHMENLMVYQGGSP